MIDLDATVFELVRVDPWDLSHTIIGHYRPTDSGTLTARLFALSDDCECQIIGVATTERDLRALHSRH